MRLGQKVRTFHQDPVGSVASKRREVVDRMTAGWGRSRLAQAGVLPILQDYNARRPPAATKPQFSDLWFLYHTVRQRHPQVVWEFGSGNSTLVLAQAVADNGVGHLISMDSLKEWAQASQEALPSHLHKVATVIHAPVEEITYGDRLAWRHCGLPATPPNFAYLDGPPLTDERNVAVDLLLVEPQLPSNFCLVIDDRQANTAFLRQHFKRQYRFSRRRWVCQQVFVMA